MELLLICLALGAVAPAVVPARWIACATGMVCLFAGLILLDERNIPFGERGNGLGELFFSAWLFLAGLAIVIGLLRVMGGGVWSQRFWAPAPALLLAVAAFHWIANRAAGAPAVAAHLLVGGAALAVALLAWLSRQRLGALADLPFLTAVLLALLVAKAAIDSARWAARARAEAAGRPYCLLTFAGREHPRPATATLELSPLVSRSGGRNSVEDAAWLVLPDGGSKMAYGWRRFGRNKGFVAMEQRPAACQPR